MSGTINRVMILGRLTADPVFRTSQAGAEIAMLNVETRESWKDKHSGERKERSEFHRVVVSNEGLVNMLKKGVIKGTLIALEGKIQTRKYQKDGLDKYITEVVLSGYGSSLVLPEKEI